MTLPTLKRQGEALDGAAHDRNILFLSGFPSLAAMMADTARGYGFYVPGNVVVTAKEGFRYVVAPSDATDHHLTTAAGLKLHVLPGDNGVYNFRAFNPAANGTTDDYAKLMLAINAVVTGEAPHKRGPTIYFPDPSYRINATVELNTKVHLIGSYNYGSGTTFIFPNGVTGFVANAFNTGNGTAISEAEATAQGRSGAAGSIFEGIMARATSVSPTRGNAAGLWMRAPVTIRDCAFNWFNGYGVLIDVWDPAEVPAFRHLWGDARGWQMKGVNFIYNGKNGLRVRGTRSGGGMLVLGNFVYNGWWGLDDHQPGRNLYLACHSATNAIGPAAGNTGIPRKSASVNHNGSRWEAVWKEGVNGDVDPAQIEALVTTEPGTNPNVWKAAPFPNAVLEWYPAWVPGQAPGQYFPGGGYKISHPDSHSLNIGSYMEDDDGIGVIYRGSGVMSFGGLQNIVASGSHILGGNGGRVNTWDRATVGDDGVFVNLMGDVENGTTLSVEKDGEVWNLFRMEELDLVIDRDGIDPIFGVTGFYSDRDFGTGAPKPKMPYMPMMALGDRRQTRMDAAPTMGEWARGDIVWRLNPVAGGHAAWVCTAGGTPGTWKACLPIAP